MGNNVPMENDGSQTTSVNSVYAQMVNIHVQTFEVVNRLVNMESYLTDNVVLCVMVMY